MALTKHNTRLWAFCIMPNHVHLLLYPERLDWRAGAFLGTLKQSVCKRALLWMHAHAPDRLALMRDEQPNGKVSYRFWQRGGGYDRNLWSDDAIWAMIDYIHLNPVEAGLCERPEQWRWSSAGRYARTGESPVALDLRGLPLQP
ncbi:MAG: transposase [Phycisphaerales bacterium]|nr:transposase [Phycisphaerales bacterium]